VCKLESQNSNISLRYCNLIIKLLNDYPSVKKFYGQLVKFHVFSMTTVIFHLFSQSWNPFLNSVTFQDAWEQCYLHSVLHNTMLLCLSTKLCFEKIYAHYKMCIDKGGEYVESKCMLIYLLFV